MAVVVTPLRTQAAVKPPKNTKKENTQKQLLFSLVVFVVEFFKMKHNSNVPAFLVKLWTLVEDADTNEFICWSQVTLKLYYTVS